jgi:hypothetical protein
VKTFARFIIVILIMGTAGSAAAQQPTETFTFDSGSAFDYPGDWTLGDADGATIVLTSDLTSITVIDHPHFATIGLAADIDSDAALEAYFADAHGSALDNEQLAELAVGERAGARFDYEDESGNQGVLLALPFTSGDFGMIDALSLDGAMQEEDAVLAIAESFDSPVQPAGRACTVSTDQARTVRVHVGPGENRGVLAFLPANQEFEIAGQNTADDGSVWWRIADASAVKPNAATSEAWVAQADVIESGACDALGTAAEPPIRVQIVAPPPQEDSASGDTTADAPPATGGLPQAGTWTVNYPGTVPASCIGDGISQETLYFPLSVPPEVVSLTLTGTGFILGERVHTPMGGNRYRGQWDFPIEGEIFTAESFLTVVSPSQMTGELHVTLVFGGGACSATAYISVTRN